MPLIGALLLALLLTSCATTSTAPDGTVTVQKPDAETTASWTELIRDLFVTKPPAAAPVVPAK